MAHASASPSVAIVRSLIDPAKLDTLKGARPANRRLRLICHHLEAARHAGEDPAGIIAQAQAALRMTGTPRAEAVKVALIRNLDILRKLGCFDEAGMAKLRTGKAPTITRGLYAGEQAHVDHIIPRAVCPEVDARLYNLEFMPETLNRRKSDQVGLRQIQLARRRHSEGLLSNAGLRAVEVAKP